MYQLAYVTAHKDKIDAILNRWQLTKIDVLEQAVTSSLRMSQTCGIIAATGKATIVAFAGTDPISIQDWSRISPLAGRLAISTPASTPLPQPYRTACTRRSPMALRPGAGCSSPDTASAAPSGSPPPCG